MRYKVRRLFVAALVTAVFVGGLMVANRAEHQYNREGFVTSVNGNVVTVDDGNYLWNIYAEGFSKYDFVKLKMYDNGTSSVYDDKVVGIKHI